MLRNPQSALDHATRSVVEGLEPRRFYNAGDLDLTFSGDGVASLDVTVNADDRGLDVARQSDGKIVVAGTASGDFLALRYTTTGALDTTFGGGDGIVTFDFGGNSDEARGVAIQADGKIVIAGVKAGNNLTNSDIAVARLNTDGSFDTGFDGDGKLTTQFQYGLATPKSESAEAVAIDSAGHVVVAGTWDDAGSLKIAVLRYLTDGTLDNAFSGDGRIAQDAFDGADQGYDVGVYTDSSNNVLVAGKLDTINGSFGVFRYLGSGTQAGTLDNTFDFDGKKAIDFDTTDGNEGAYSLALASDGKIVLAGYAKDQFALARLNSNGSFDNSFAGNGKKLFEFTEDDSDLLRDEARTVAVQSDGKILVAGVVNSNLSNTTGDFGMARLNTDGTLDTSFSGDGRAVYAPASGTRDVVEGMVLGTVSGQAVVYLGGYSGIAGSPSTNKVLVTRYIGADLTIPNAPSNLIASSSSSSQVVLTWNDNSSNESGFVVERSTNATFTANLVSTTTSANQVIYFTGSLTSSTVYYFRVRATNGIGNSAATGTSSAVTFGIDDPTVILGTVNHDPEPDPITHIPDLSTPAIYTFTRQGNISSSLTIEYSLGGSAIPNVDYDGPVLVSGSSNRFTLTFSAGSSTAEVTLEPLTDQFNGQQKTVEFEILSKGIPIVGWAAGKSRVRLTLQNGTIQELSNPTIAQWRAALQLAITSGNLIKELRITGHGSSELIDLNDSGGTIAIDPDSGHIIDSQGELNATLTAALAPNAPILLQGCNTGFSPLGFGSPLAKVMSQQIPNHPVTGEGTYSARFGSNTIIGLDKTWLNGNRN